MHWLFLWQNAEQVNCARKGLTWHSYSIFMWSEIIVNVPGISCSYLFLPQQTLYWNEQIINSSTQLWLVSVLNNTDYFITKHVTAVRKVMGCRLHGWLLLVVEAVWLVSLHPEVEWVWSLSVFVRVVIWVFGLQVWLKMM